MLTRRSGVTGARALVGALVCSSVVAACSGASTISLTNPEPDAATGGDAAQRDTSAPDTSVGADASDGGADGSTDDGALPDAFPDAPSDAPSDSPDGVADAGDAACNGAVTKVEQPLDIYMMIDQSASMDEAINGGGSKWSAMTGALNAFMSSPLDGVSVGIQFFGLPANGTGACPSTCTLNTDCGPGGTCLGGTCLGCATDVDSCTAADYAHPDVEIAPLPGNATPIATSIGKHAPSTSTPTSAALQGAVDHAKAWANAHPDHLVIALFATDGEPTECDTDLTHINAIAAAAASGSPKIPTFVIGVGASLTNLNGLAAAGGTQQAFIVDPSLPNLNQQFLAALDAVRVAASACRYEIPAPAMSDPSGIAVQIKGTTATQMIAKVSNAAACPATGDAWYFDDAVAPKKILLCAPTCKRVSTDLDEVDVVTGCHH